MVGPENPYGDDDCQLPGVARDTNDDDKKTSRKLARRRDPDTSKNLDAAAMRRVLRPQGSATSAPATTSRPSPNLGLPASFLPTLTTGILP